MKLIAEPWDVGPGGYQVGNFPVQWSEWNGIYRDVMRDFWRGQAGVGDFAARLTGSSDLYEPDGRNPFASINFITAHDGFPLADLVSYNEKHNEANKEDNRDGTDDNRSWNCGAEGPTDDPEINALRARQQRNFLVDAHAVAGRADAPRRRRDLPHPARQQQRLVPGQRDLLVRVGHRRERASGCSRSRSGVIALRQGHPVFRRRHFLSGDASEELRAAGRLVVPHGRPSDDRSATGSSTTCTTSACSSTARSSRTSTRAGERIEDDSFLLLFNAHHEDVEFRLPNAALRRRAGTSSCRPPSRTPSRGHGPSPRASSVQVIARSVVVLKRAR